MFFPSFKSTRHRGEFFYDFCGQLCFSYIPVPKSAQVCKAVSVISNRLSGVNTICSQLSTVKTVKPAIPEYHTSMRN